MESALAVGLRIIAILPVMMLAMNGATVAVLYFGGRMVMGAEFDLGSLQAFINYIFQILMSVMMVAMSLLQLSRAQACAHRIHEVLSTEPSVEDKPEAARQALPRPSGPGGVPGRVLQVRDLRHRGRRALPHQLHRTAGSVRSPGGGHRHGQIHPGQSDPPVLRRHRRGRPGGRDGRAGLPPGGASGPDRHGAAK